MKKKFKISAHVSQAWGSDMKVTRARPSTSSLRFEVQSQSIKEKIKISTHVSQALGSDIMVSATRPSTSSLKFEIQSQ
jgi:hypothetical protein